MVAGVSDASLRNLERAFWADPTDENVGRRYVRALHRAGEDERAASVLFRVGDRVEACKELGIRWEADAPSAAAGRSTHFWWRKRKLTPDELQAMIAKELASFDPVCLAQHWPRRLDGVFRLNTALPIQRYRAHELDAPHRRLTLLAWTPGTATLWERPKDRGKHIITVSLETRSTRKKLLDPKLWQRART